MKGHTIAGQPIPQRKRKRATPGGPWICKKCETVLRSWAAAERHADAHDGGARLELVLHVNPDLPVHAARGLAE